MSDEFVNVVLGVAAGFWAGLLAAHFPELPFRLQIAVIIASVVMAVILVTRKSGFWRTVGSWLRRIPGIGTQILKAATRLARLAANPQTAGLLTGIAILVSAIAPALGRSFLGSVAVVLLLLTSVFSLVEKWSRGRGM